MTCVVCSAADLVLRAPGAILWHAECADWSLDESLHRLHLSSARLYVVLPQAGTEKTRSTHAPSVSLCPRLMYLTLTVRVIDLSHIEC